MKRTIPFLLAGLLVFACYLYFFVDLPETVKLVRSVDPFYYSFAIIALLLDVLFFALTWQFLLYPLSVKVPFSKVFTYVWVGTFMNILVPAESISGEVSRGYLMTKEVDEEQTGKVVASLIGHRILSMILMLGSLAAGCVVFFVSNNSFSNFIAILALLGSAGTIIPLVIIFLLCIKPRWTKKIVDALISFISFISRGRWQPSSLRDRVARALKIFHKAIKTLGAKPRKLVLPVAFSIISWLFALLISYFVFFSINYSVSFTVVLVVFSISITVQSIPLGIPADVGVADTIMTALYIGAGIAPSVSAAATILVRLLTIWLRFFVGFIAFQWVGIKTVGR
jgi:hypothetical protein